MVSIQERGACYSKQLKSQLPETFLNEMIAVAANPHDFNWKG